MRRGEPHRQAGPGGQRGGQEQVVLAAPAEERHAVGQEPVGRLVSQGMMLKLKNVATWPADSPRSLSVILKRVQPSQTVKHVSWAIRFTTTVDRHGVRVPQVACAPAGLPGRPSPRILGLDS